MHEVTAAQDAGSSSCHSALSSVPHFRAKTGYIDKHYLEAGNWSPEYIYSLEQEPKRVQALRVLLEGVSQRQVEDAHGSMQAAERDGV